MNSIQEIPLDKLLLDKKNPRIHQTISENITQLDLAEFIYRKFGISDLKDSILKNGYFPVEPLVVIPSNDNYIVVEGNRRLTTLKILCDEAYREHCIKSAIQGDYIATNSLLEQSSKIPVVIADNRESVNAYLGVRHLGGVKKWEPLAQAKYVHDKIINQKNSTKDKTVKASIDKFVKETNNEKSNVLNFFYKFCIYKHMIQLIQNDTSLNEATTDLNNKFSLLEVALGKTGTSSVAKYIGIESYNRLDAEDYENVISEDNNNQVKNLIKWVFMPNSPIQESREIGSYLKKILKSEESTKAFERGADKDEALLLSNSSEDIVKDSCSKIHKSLSQIQNSWDRTKPKNREELKEFYDYNVLQKTKITNKTIDL